MWTCLIKRDETNIKSIFSSVTTGCFLHAVTVWTASDSLKFFQLQVVLLVVGAADPAASRKHPNSTPASVCVIIACMAVIPLQSLCAWASPLPTHAASRVTGRLIRGQISEGGHFLLIPKTGVRLLTWVNPLPEVAPEPRCWVGNSFNSRFQTPSSLLKSVHADWHSCSVGGRVLNISVGPEFAFWKPESLVFACRTERQSRMLSV